MSIFIGATLALAIGGFATWVGFDRGRAYGIAAIYFGALLVNRGRQGMASEVRA